MHIPQPNSPNNDYALKLAALSQQFRASSPNTAYYPVCEAYEDLYATDNPSCEERDASGNVVINGVSMSQVALTQLRKLGLPLEWYTADELEDAVMACSNDGRLIDDPDGETFKDKLSLDPDEIEQENREPLPALHGFLKEEYEELFPILSPKKRNRDKSSPKLKFAGILTDCDRQHIMAGMKLLRDPLELDECASLTNGLEMLPRQPLHEMAMAV